jgi:hypothetical protein
LVVAESGNLLGPRVGIEQDFGNGIGWRHGYTHLEGFIPVLQTPCQSVLFADLRSVVFDDVRLWQFDGGGGYRWCSEVLERIVGVNGFYDYRDTGKSSFHQLGLGSELLGNRWDLRTNLYFPVGPQHHLLAQTSTPAVHFQGFNIVVASQTQLFEAAMRGFDLEVGRSVPVLEQFDPRAFLGFYHYDAEGGKPANGIRGRFTAKLTERLHVETQVQNDAVFRTTASAGVSWSFGGPSGWSRGRRPLPERLGDFVVREPSVVVQKQQRTNDELAIDPATGQPLVVKHALASAAAGGNGSFEHPYQTLGQLQAGSGPGQILFVQNGMYPGGITLQPGQRLLGDGIVHVIVARQGTFALPILQPGATPTITVLDQPTVGGIYPGLTAAVVLAANTEVSGWSFSPQGPGLVRPHIYAAGITGGVNVNRNRLSGVAALSDITGPVTFADNISATPDGPGTAYLSRITGPVTFSRNTIDTTFNTSLSNIAGPLTYTDNTIRFFGPAVVLSFTGGNSTWIVRNNVFTGPQSSGPAVSIVANSGSLCVNLIGNSSNTGYAVSMLQFFASGNTGSISTDGSATQVSTPCP